MFLRALNTPLDWDSDLFLTHSFPGSHKKFISENINLNINLNTYKFFKILVFQGITEYFSLELCHGEFPWKEGTLIKI